METNYDNVSDLIKFYNTTIRTDELTSFEDAEPDQKNLICELYMIACLTGLWISE